MRRISLLTYIPALAALCSIAAGSEPQSLATSEVEAWIRHLVPLPRKIELKERVCVPARGVRVIVPDDAPALVRQAATELREAMGASAGDPDTPAFSLELSTDAGQAPSLADLPNHDQAYAVRPTPHGDGLVLIGGSPRGLYYAAKTLQQFIIARRQGEQVLIPLVTITDWPDLQARGLWGSDSAGQLKWMSDRKMNFDEQIARNTVTADRRCEIGLSGSKQRIIDEGPTWGIDPVPVILHLEQLSRTGIFGAYPDLIAKDGKPGTVCYSNPTFVDVLANWLVLWRGQPGVKTVDVWMAENLGGQPGCQCESCRREDRNVLEARAIVAAWKKARQTHPDLGLYTLTSEETEKSNPRVFQELPREIRIWYYHSLFTYNSSESPMIRPYLVDAIREGRRLGVCLNLCAAVGFNQPFTGAHFVHHRMNEFVDKKLSGFMGYATPRVCSNEFNVEAAAEWGWNARGRSPHEFALSWAVRQGFKDPERFAQWSDTIGPVAWDIYGSEWPSGQKRKRPGRMATLLKEGNVPELGSSLSEGGFRIPWSDIRTPDQLNRDVAQAARALQLARDMDIDALIQESLVIQGYIHSLKALWELKQLVKPSGVADSDKSSARRWFTMYAEGLGQARNALRAWEASLESCGGRHYGFRGGDILADMIDEMNATAADLGCRP